MSGTWRPIANYPYEVSAGGRVRRTATGRVLRATLDSDGYPHVSLYARGRRRSARVHQLVAEAHLGPRPTPAHEVNHRSGVKTNNRVRNIEWATRSQNLLHTLHYGLRPWPSGVNNGRAKLTEAQVRRIRAQHPRWTYRELAERFGVSISTIGAVVSGRTWADAG